MTNPQQDRFDTHWTAPHDRAAIQYTIRKNIPNLTWDNYKTINSIANKFESERHAADPDLASGTDTLKDRSDQWKTATRGDAYRIRYAAWKESARKRLKDLDQNVSSLYGWRKEDAQNQIICLKGDIPDLEQLIGINEELEKMVVDEVTEIWDWRAGLAEQWEQVQRILSLENDMKERPSEVQAR